MAPSVTCTDGTLTSDNTAEVLLQACSDGFIGVECVTEGCPPDDVCSFHVLHWFTAYTCHFLHDACDAYERVFSPKPPS